MAKKHFTLRLTATSFLAFLLIVFASFSCQDHEVPEQPQQPELAKINTLDISGNAINGFNHSVQFTDLGAVPVVEYGMVVFAGKPGDVKVPDIEALDPLTDRKYAFVGVGYMPPNLAAKTVTRAYDGPDGNPVRLFYRAYAMLLNNTIVYGEVKFVDFIKNQNNIVKPVIKTLDASKGDGSLFIGYSVQFEDLGNVPVTEYGIVGYVGEPGDDQTPTVPINPANIHHIKYVFDGNGFMPPNLEEKLVVREYNQFIGGNIRLFYRAYATLNNGEVVYGEVKFLDFETEVLPAISTLEPGSLSSFGQNDVLVSFRVQFTGLGNVPVFQYGIIYDSGVPGDTKTPDFPITASEVNRSVAGGPNGPALNNLDLNLRTNLTSITRGQSTKRIFYRAYAMLSTGEFVYGTVRSLDIAP